MVFRRIHVLAEVERFSIRLSELWQDGYLKLIRITSYPFSNLDEIGVSILIICASVRLRPREPGSSRCLRWGFASRRRWYRICGWSWSRFFRVKIQSLGPGLNLLICFCLHSYFVLPHIFKCHVVPVVNPGECLTMT